jgi:bifunctional non-homologous end joining protein LigD
MALELYRKNRNFRNTPEPRGQAQRHGSKFGGEKSRLLFKRDDEFARPAEQGRITEDEADSVASGRTLEAIAGGSKAQPAARPKRARTTKETSSIEVAGVAISNPGKLLYPEAGITKLQLARYYEAVGEWIVPHLRNRPLTLVRCPDGWNKQCFYQKNAPDRIHRAIVPVIIPTSTGESVYMMANSTEAVVAMLQSGALELHPWGSTARKLGHPDRMIFDFDPDEGLGYREVVEAARMVRDLLEGLGLRSFLKTTGGKGLHVVVPIAPTQDWDTIKGFTHAIADSLALMFPERFTSAISKARRKGRIFIDYLRNAEGATAVAAYSIRARANAPVAMPIAWEELAKDVRFDHFNVRTVPARLKRRKHDPWAEFFTVKQRVTASMLKKVGFEK